MGGDTRDGARTPATPGDGSGGGEELSRIAARAYRPSRVDVDEALRHKWLEIWYQPKIDLQHRSVVGAEALARIRHPELGIVLPMGFLPAISEGGLAHLTEHALLSALRNWSLFAAAGFNLRLAVNIPIAALQQVPVAALVAEHRPKAEHWPGLLVDVPEAEIGSDLDRAYALATELRDSGVSISVDGFGAGYASFAQARELAFAELKVDIGHVKNCAVDPANAAVCRAAIDLAHRLGAVAVAEGIESAADLQALQLMGCDLGQGVLIAPPMPVPAFLDLLRQRLSKPVAPAPPAEAPVPQAARPPGIDRVA